jgi:hypothetical protein
MAVAKGYYCDHGWAVYFTQESRRCCLLDTTFGLTDEEALGLLSVHGPLSSRDKPDQGRIRDVCITQTSFPAYLRSTGIASIA